MRDSFVCVLVAASICWGATAVNGYSQLDRTLNLMESLEQNRDPKCHATATRLENFMYGTPLSPEARDLKNSYQKEFLHRLWVLASEKAAAAEASQIEAEHIQPALEEFFTLTPLSDQLVELEIGPQSLQLATRDLDHYSSVAYSIRALLSLQQDMLFAEEGDDLLPLSIDAGQHARTACDVFTLALLQAADHRARAAGHSRVQPADVRMAWDRVVEHLPDHTGQPEPDPARLDNPPESYLMQLIESKVRAYEKYNDISNPVFVRNLQVFFAKKMWPATDEEGQVFRQLFTELTVAFARQLYREGIAEAGSQPIVRSEHLRKVIDRLMPHRVNAYEDVIYYPYLPREERMLIEAYDLDAFRDSGVHWRYFQFALEDIGGPVRELDPFAAEYLTEQIAQFGMLLLRTAGRVADEDGRDRLAAEDLKAALARIQELAQRHPSEPPSQNVEIISSAGAADSRALFTDVTELAGIDFEHRSSDWLSRLLRSYIQKEPGVITITIPPAFGGGGVAAEDVNGDRHIDLLLLSGLGNKLYLNRGDGTFTNVTEQAAIGWTRPDGRPGEPRQPLIADFDNDGDQDIVITYVDDPHRMYLNRGDGTFVDVTEQAGLGGKGLVGGPATVFDYNHDGLLDIYIQYFGDYLNGVLPTLARHNTNGLPDRLFRNLGNGRFADVTELAGIHNTGWGQAVTHTDLNGDGWQDLIAGNDFGADRYFINRKDGTFEEVSGRLGTDKANYTMSLSVGDLNRDQRPDIYVSSIVTMNKDESYVLPSEETVMKFNPDKLARMRVVEANDLFMSTAAEGAQPEYTLSDAVKRGFARTGWSWDADFFDCDLDGDDDLYVLNGMNDYAVYGKENPYYRDPVQGRALDVEFAHSGADTNVLLLNQDGELLRAPSEAGLALKANSRSAVYLDMDRDGDEDIVVNNYHGPAVVYRNQAEKLGHNWVAIRLAGDPAQGVNRDAIGARVEVLTDDGSRQWREVRGSTGYMSVHPRTLIFGLGGHQIEKVIITWPGGQVQEEQLKAPGEYLIRQERKTPASI